MVDELRLAENLVLPRVMLAFEYDTESRRPTASTYLVVDIIWVTEPLGGGMAGPRDSCATKKAFQEVAGSWVRVTLRQQRCRSNKHIGWKYTPGRYIEAN